MSSNATTMPGQVGDLLLTFRAEAAAAPSRAGGDRSRVEQRGEGTLWSESANAAWRGFPYTELATETWRIRLLGELYETGGRSAEHVLREAFQQSEPAAALNGHFLLWAWHEPDGTWHVWTDRFATLHAYYGTDGERAAVGTFSPAVVAAASRRELDWVALASLFSYGYFLADWTHFKDVHLLQPASHYTFDEAGHLLRQYRYWTWWHDPDRMPDFDGAVEMFGEITQTVVREHRRGERVAMSISGGLDSRTVLAAGTSPGQHGDSIPTYGYGYSPTSVEVRIARELAAARGLPFHGLVIGSYLFEQIEEITAATEGFVDILHARPAGVLDELVRLGDTIVTGHWGTWFRATGLPEDLDPRSEDALAAYVMRSITSQPGEWLLKHLCQPNVPSLSTAEAEHREVVRADLAELDHIEDPDFRVKCLKTDHRGSRFVNVGFRNFQPSAFLRLPFYDARIADYFCALPTAHVEARRLQIEYLKRFAPDLARIKWQARDANLYTYHRFGSWHLPKRAAGYLHRRLFGGPKSNHAVQFFGDGGREGLNRWLLQPGLRLYDYAEPAAIRTLVEGLYDGTHETGQAQTVSMLLSFSVWLELYG